MLTYRERLEAELAIVQGIIAKWPWDRFSKSDTEYAKFFYKREKELKALINSLLTPTT